MEFDLVLFAKSLGFIAFLVTCFGYTRADDNQLRLAIAVSSLLLSIHFGLMGAFIAAISLLINAIRNNISRYRKGIKWFIFFLLIQLIISGYFYTSLKDLYPIIGSLITGYAVFCTKGLFFRILMLIGTVLWLINNILYASYGAILLDILGMIMNLIGMYKIKQLHNRSYKKS